MNSKEREFIMLYAGELSTQDNLKHLHPDLVRQIVEQIWPLAKKAGAIEERRWWAERWKIIDSQIGDCCGCHPFDDIGIKACKELDEIVKEGPSHE